MTKYLFFTIIALALFTGVDCKKDKDIVDPPPTDDVKPGRRDYVWTVDTLKLSPYDLFTPTRIWGSAPNDIWITGFGDVSWNLLWHYDGVSWKKDSLQRQISPSALWGTSSNNIWLGNYSHNSFWRYDGTKWYKYSENTPPAGFDKVVISNMCGTSASDIWAVGGADQFNGGTQYMGVIMHFNGSQWQFVQIPEIRVGFTSVKQQHSSGLLFLEGTRYESTGDTSKLYIFDGKNIQQIYSDVKYGNIEDINGEFYFVSDKKIYKYLNNNLKLWKDFSAINMIGRMLGRSEKDFFTFTQEGISQGIAHYNGEDFKVLFIIPEGLRVSDAFIFNTDFFIACYSLTTNLNVVIHGKLTTKRQI